MSLQKIFTSFLKKEFSSNILFDSKEVSFKSLDKEFQVILKKEFSDPIRNYKKEIRNYSK